MKKIILAIVVLFMIGCKHNDEHNHTEKEQQKENKKDEHNEDAENITMLTAEQIKAVGIKFGHIENKQLTSTIKANGILRVPNSRKGNITSLYGGVIKSLRVQIGDYVKKGQVIATIANPQFVQLQESYLVAESKITLAKQELERQQQLHAENIGALKNLQNAKSQLNSLLAQKASLCRQIKMMGIDLNSVARGNLKSSLLVRSPLNGTISNLLAQIGSYVDASSPIGEIVDNGALHLDLQIFEKDLPLVKVGQIIHFTLTNNPTGEYDAKIFSIGSSFEDDSKTIPIHCTVTGNKKDLFDGMNVTAIVSLDKKTTPAVPNEAIVSANGKDYIFIVTEEEENDDHEGEEHREDDGHDHDGKNTAKEEGIHFKKIQVVKGVSNMGYTEVNFVQEIPIDAEIVVKKAFFINAKLSGGAGHGHSH